MNDELETSRESRLRRAAKQQGLVLRKSRIDGTWGVLNPERNEWVVAPRSGNGANGFALAAIEDYLKRRPRV